MTVRKGCPHMASNQANVPVEMIESDYLAA